MGSNSYYTEMESQIRAKHWSAPYTPPEVTEDGQRVIIEVGSFESGKGGKIWKTGEGNLPSGYLYLTDKNAHMADVPNVQAVDWVSPSKAYVDSMCNSCEYGDGEIAQKFPVVVVLDQYHQLGNPGEQDDSKDFEMQFLNGYGDLICTVLFKNIRFIYENMHFDWETQIACRSSIYGAEEVAYIRGSQE